jgi:hypothetical protein
MNNRELFQTCLAVCATVFFSLSASAQWAVPEVQEPSSEADVKAALTGGVPSGRWKEGLLFEGIEPMPWLKSAANWFPNTEQVQPNEMRIHFMESCTPNLGQGAMDGTSFLLGLLSGVVGTTIVFAIPVIVWLIAAAVVDILLDPSVAEAPEIEPDPAIEELSELKADMEKKLAEMDAKMNEAMKDK